MTTPPPRYDAFLSYSQRDHSTVSWLRNILCNYWVPGRKRRAIFLDRMSMGAGVLDEGLKTALRDSRFLIVCCSANARESEWVDKEVEEFLKTHTDREVLICAVGAEHEVVFPRSIDALEQRRKGKLRWPDLRGFPEIKPRRDQERVITEALSLLAELLGLPGKDALVDAVLRGRARIRRITAGIAALLIVGSAAAWGWLNYTTNGAVYLARRRVLDAAATEVYDTPALATTAHALGLLGRRSDIEQLAATVKGREFRGLVLAAGYTALPEPDCAQARTAMEGIDESWARSEPRSFLLYEKHCGGAWSDRLQPDPTKPDLLLGWGRALAQTGHIDRARAVLNRPEFPPKDRLPLIAAIAIASRSEFVVTDSDLTAWAGDNDASSRLYAAVQELEVLDVGARLTDSGSRRVVTHGIEAYVDMALRGFDNWNHRQQLAAHAAGAQEPGIEDLLGPVPASVLDLPDYAPGLAWRALALHRLGRLDESRTTFKQAEAAANTFTPQTRSWREWFDVATAAALAGDWRRAFAAAESPGNEAIRFELRCRVIELWAHRNRPESRW